MGALVLTDSGWIYHKAISRSVPVRTSSRLDDDRVCSRRVPVRGHFQAGYALDRFHAKLDLVVPAAARQTWYMLGLQQILAQVCVMQDTLP